MIPEHRDHPKISVKQTLSMWNSFMVESGIREFCAKCGGKCCESFASSSKNKILVCGGSQVDPAKCCNSIACAMYLCGKFKKYIPKELQYLIARFADRNLYGKTFPKKLMVTDYSSLLHALQKVDWKEVLDTDPTL